MSSTHKTYQVAERRYLTFCNSFSLRPLPTSEEILCYFVACLGQQGLAHTSIRTYLSGVRQLQIAHGFKDPGIDQMPRLKQILRGVKAVHTSIRTYLFGVQQLQIAHGFKDPGIDQMPVVSHLFYSLLCLLCMECRMLVCVHPQGQ